MDRLAQLALLGILVPLAPPEFKEILARLVLRGQRVPLQPSLVPQVRPVPLEQTAYRLACCCILIRLAVPAR